MVKNFKILYLSIGLAFLFLIISLFQIKGYFLTSYEGKYVTFAVFANSFRDILQANTNGINVYDGGPLYFLIVRFFIKIFGSQSELIVRLPSVLISLMTIAFVYLFMKKFTENKYFSLISLIVFSLNISFLTFSSVSIPQIMASDFALISVLFGCYPLFSKNSSKNHLYFTGFWFFIFLVVFTDLLTAVVPLSVVILSYLMQKRFTDFLKPVNLVFAIFSAFLVAYNWQMLSYKVSESIPLFDYFLNDRNIKIQLFLFVKYFVGIFAGLMPWSVLFIAILGMVVSRFGKLLKSLSDFEFTNENKILLVSLTGFFLSSLAFFLNHSFSNVILADSFAALSVGYFWYKHIFKDKFNALINFSSSFFFGITLLFAVSLIIAYFFMENYLKLYFEPLLIPLITITLLVAIPGFIFVVLNKKVFNLSVHILFSLIFYFVLTNVLFNYLNSFGESELITYAYGARDNVYKLATYDLKNKYVIPFYFGNIVEFNDKLTDDEIYNKYGNTYDIRLIMKIKSLENFDGKFVYELLESGNTYCVITNIKKLPSDNRDESE